MPSSALWRERIERVVSDLPLLARVAFAARCARRVQPVFEAGWPAAPPHTVADIDKALSRAERYAGTRNVLPQFIHDSATATAKAAEAAHALGHVDTATSAAMAAVRAAREAMYAVADADHDRERKSRWDSPPALHASVDAAGAAADAARAPAAEDSIVAAMDFDVEQLSQAARNGGWDDTTCVPREFFGDLWPDGEPEGWPETALRDQRDPGEVELPEDAASESDVPSEQPALEIHIDPGGADRKTLQELLEALSDLHMACGGLGLEFTTDDQSVYAIEGVVQ